jgi:hypothetical protein
VNQAGLPLGQVTGTPMFYCNTCGKLPHLFLPHFATHFLPHFCMLFGWLGKRPLPQTHDNFAMANSTCEVIKATVVHLINFSANQLLDQSIFLNIQKLKERMISSR